MEATKKKVQAAREAEDQRIAAREAVCRENRYESCQAQRAWKQRVAAREAACRERGYNSCREETIETAAARREAACRERGYESCAAKREDERLTELIESDVICSLFHYDAHDIKDCVRKRMLERGFRYE